MRPLLLILAAVAVSSCSTTYTYEPKPFEIEVQDIRPRYMSSENFKRIDEYRTGREYRGNRLIVRSQPVSRNGTYFIVFLDKNVRKIPYGTQLILDVLTPYSPNPRQYVFELPSSVERPSTREIFLGLTGDDWETPKEKPIAWKLTLRHREKTYDTYETFLWQPALERAVPGDEDEEAESP